MDVEPTKPDLSFIQNIDNLQKKVKRDNKGSWKKVSRIVLEEHTLQKLVVGAFGNLQDRSVDIGKIKKYANIEHISTC